MFSDMCVPYGSMTIRGGERRLIACCSICCGVSLVLLPATGGLFPNWVATADPLLVTGLPPAVDEKLFLAACRAESGVCPARRAAM
jgi:hypothetical protein